MHIMLYMQTAHRLDFKKITQGYQKQAIAVLFAVCILFGGIAIANAETATVAPQATAQPTTAARNSATASATATPVSIDATATDAPETAVETIIEDFEGGHWLYENTETGIRIEITRKIDEDKKILWYEADLQCNENTPLQFITANLENPGKGFSYPEMLVCRHQAVFGINDDQFGHRMYNRQKVGIIIRNGKLISSLTRKSGNLSWPTLDTAAFFSDGSMQTFSSQEHTGEEYLAMGAQTVLSFGPWLVQKGETNPLCAKHFTTREPRTAIGMIAPYHYIVLSVEGRVKQSRGVGMQWLAEQMKALGAQEAINLDGGKTTSLVFMGKSLKSNNPTGKPLKRRSVSGMITLGTSDKIPTEIEMVD